MNEKKYSVIKMDIPVYVSDTQVGDFKEIEILKDHEYKVILCPNCLEGLCLMRGEITNDDYEVEGLYCYHGLRFEDELEFNQHLDECQKPYPEDGVFEVKDLKAKNLVCNLSSLSRYECQWDISVVDNRLFEKGARAFVIVENGIIVGFNAFFPQKIKDYGNQMVMWEIYVFPTFRRKDRAKRLLQYAMKAQNIEVLIVKSPISENGEYFLSSLNNLTIKVL